MIYFRFRTGVSGRYRTPGRYHGPQSISSVCVRSRFVVRAILMCIGRYSSAHRSTYSFFDVFIYWDRSTRPWITYPTLQHRRTKKLETSRSLPTDFILANIAYVGVNPGVCARARPIQLKISFRTGVGDIAYGLVYISVMSHTCAMKELPFGSCIASALRYEET